MRPDPLILAFDTSAAHCAAALLSGDRILASREEPMATGQAERLVPLLEEVLREGGVAWRDLVALGVGTGPGNFTGVRISVAAARGLALGLGIPAIGVSMFEALLLLDRHGPLSEPALILSLEAPRRQAYVQHFRHGRPQAPPRVIDLDAPPADLELPMNMKVRGFMAEAIARPFAAAWEPAAPTRVAEQVARIAELRRSEPSFDPSARPAPLYVRGPDAAPPRDPAPLILPG